MNADGSGRTILLDSAGGTSPAWSPDGTRIAFASAFDQEVYVIDADGTNRTSVAFGSQYGGHPDWSPDAKYIAYAEDVLDPSDPCDPLVGNELCSDIFVITAGGTGRRNLTNDSPNPGGYNLDPAWSPDNGRVAFSAHTNLATINVDGSGQTRIGVPGITPDWQPLSAVAPYPRPGGATPLLVWLVPSYEPCTSPNALHSSPLAEGSCNPPVQVSDQLTTSKIGQGIGYVRLDVVPGNASTAADEADVTLDVLVRDVRNASDQSDYSGSLILAATIRATDRSSGFGGVAATSSDARFDVPFSCVPTSVTPRGSDCSLATSLDAAVPGAIAEGKRTVLAARSVTVLDAGLDGDVSAPSCPPACGTGDEEPYQEQGVFAP